MFQFLQPLWLIASAGIIIPVIIHLWSVKQGKILQVGSISLLAQSDRQQAKSIKLKDLLLLLIRCLLIIVLAMLLSKPQYQQPLSVQQEKGWLLIEKEQLDAAYRYHKQVIDSLLNAGFKFHYFEQGFTEANFTDALQHADDTLQQPQQSYWTLLKSLEQEVPSTLPVFLFTSNTLKRFEGQRPQLSINLSWKTFPLIDSVSSWLSSGYQTSTGDVNVMVAKSDPTATIAINNTFSLQEPPTNFTVRSAENGYDVLYKDDQNSSTVFVDTSTLNVTIFTDKFPNDANYLKAAIDAVKEFGKYKIALRTTRNVDDIKQGQDWLFWLSEQPVPKTQATRVFQYASGKIQPVHSWINVAGNHLDNERIEILKLVQTDELGSEQQVIWKDGFGNPVLTKQTGSQEVYRFYSRFNPSWNDLAWSSSFPAMILSLIKNEDNNVTNALDKRIVDASQIQPVLLKESNVLKEKFTTQVDLSKWFWIMAFVLFCLERVISFTSRKEVRYA